MSSTKVMTIFHEMGGYGSTEVHKLYCEHHHGSDTVTFFEEDGSVATMAFMDWSSGMDKWDAMNKLWFPFKDEWGGELLDDVEYYYGEINEIKSE